MPTQPNRTADFADLLRVFARIGCLSFGGPAAQIALMHSEVVDRLGWVREQEYLHALNFCHLLPGPEAQQLATWIGWRLHGLKGGLAAGLLFVVPGALLMLALSTLYALAANLDWFSAAFLGVKAAVLAIVVQALIRIAGRALDTRFKQGLAISAFLALFLFDLPFPAVVLGAGALGMIVAAWRPGWLALKPVSGEARAAAPTWRAMGRTALAWGAIWALPLALVLATLGKSHVLWDIGLFFSQLAIVTFGGAYAVLAYMAQEAVQTFGWLQPGEMADGLGLAETTPGPLILVTQHVGFLAAFRSPEPFSPITAGILGAALTTWVTFAPCFLWIFLGAPFIERLRENAALAGALSAITAAVVGVILNLALWFAIHAVFRTTVAVGAGPVAFDAPVLASIDPWAAALTLFALVAVFRLKLGLFTVLALCAAAGMALRLAGLV